MASRTGNQRPTAAANFSSTGRSSGGEATEEGDFITTNFAAFAHACGGVGFTIDDPTNCGDILNQALAVTSPVIEAVVDPLEPLGPPKLAEEAAKLSQALQRGKPNREELAANLAYVSNYREMV